ncbi:hypothetical protein D5S17_27995 [Pseudonocardiaceae bacterium YIM PH 21723]|nr:hypothetical protein D5S17_27995 [Pseudonocardiaceae bacterium YIM PH 21723]
MTKGMRTLCVTIAAFTLLGVVTGCGSGPSRANAAAVIGDTTIPVSDIQQRLDAVLKKEPGADKLSQQRRLDDVSRQLVTLAVRHELIQQAAKRENLSVDEKQINDLIDQVGGAEKASKGTVYTPERFHERTSDQLLTVALGTKYLSRLSVTFDFTFAAQRDEALAKAKEMASGPDGVKRVIERDKARNLEAQFGVTHTAKDNPKLATLAMFGAPQGSVVAFQLGQDGEAAETGFMIAHIVKREVAPATGQQAPSDQQDSRAMESFGLRMLAFQATESTLELSPRYGEWDEIELSALGANNPSSGVLYRQGGSAA